MQVPSITWTNQRYRGTMEADKHMLFVQQVVHDIFELYSLIYAHPNTGDKGQHGQIQHNHKRIITWYPLEPGEDDTVFSNLSTTNLLNTPERVVTRNTIPYNSLTVPDYNIELDGMTNRVYGLTKRAEELYNQITP